MESSTVEQHPTPTGTRPARPRRAARMRIPRSRGAVSGLLLVLLGIWAGLIPFVGPYFNYEFSSDQSWVITWDRVWLDVLPAAALFLGGLILLASRHRVAGAVGAWLAIVGSAWFAGGPAASLLWDAGLGPASPIGPPVGSNGVHVLEYIGFFYGVAALGMALAAFALGRLSVVGVRDLEYAIPGTGAEGDGRRAPADDGGQRRDTGDGSEPAEPVSAGPA